MKGDLRFVVPALAGSSFIPPKGGTTNVSRRLMQYPGKRGAPRTLHHVALSPWERGMQLQSLMSTSDSPKRAAHLAY